MKGRSIALFFSKTTRTRKDKASQNNHFFSLYLLVVKPEEEEADEIEIEALCANIFLYAFVCECVSGSAKVGEIAFIRFFSSFDGEEEL